MASAKRWIVRILGGLVGLVVVALGVIYAMSTVSMNKTYSPRDYPIAVASDSASLARGEHIARLSCFGCHRDSLQGGIMFEAPGIARIVAPNVVERMKAYSDGELAGFLRYGARKDGRSGFVMPPPGFYHISDADLGALIAFLRRQPLATTPDLPGNSYGPLGRLGIVTGQFKYARQLIDTTAERVGGDPASATTRHGEYLARMICSGCHSPKLTGDPGPPPSANLAGAAGYSLSEFLTLLNDAKPRGNIKLTLMGDVVKNDLHHLTDAEVTAIHEYLKTLPQTGVPGVGAKE